MTAGDDSLDGATDVHVHLMPDRLMAAIRGALNDEAGRVRERPAGLVVERTADGRHQAVRHEVDVDVGRPVQ